MSEFLHGNLTPWGYIVDAETIPDFITAVDFGNYTAGKFGTDSRIAANIPSASASIRDYCGWHVAPSLTCGIIYRVQDIRDAFVGPDILIQLPATFVSSVEKVVLDAVMDSETGLYVGDQVDDFDIEPSGLLRIYDAGPRDRKSKIFIKYTAGYTASQTAALKELTADLVSHAVANPYGINSESAGGVSVSYSANWSGRTTSTALANDTRETLDAYKVRGIY